MALSISKQVISADAAFIACKAAIEHGRKIGAKMVAAICDNGGNLIALWRDDGAFIASITIAKDKAKTAAGFGISTDKLCEILSPNEVLRDGIAKQESVILFGGGFPIIENGETIGGIGASGGSEDQDRECAKAGLKAIIPQAEI